jgi:acetyl-CoA carboxylase carboxyl transferase subunit beta
MQLFNEKIEISADTQPEEKIETLCCNGCGREIIAEILHANYFICPYCGYLFRQPAYNRIEMIVDNGSFIEIEREAESKDPISFPGYKSKIATEKAKSKAQEA